MSLAAPDTVPPHEVYTALLSHELRTPVTSLFAYLQLLDDDRLFADPDTLRSYLSKVRGRAADLVRLVSELTTFTELITGDELKSHSGMHSLSDVIADVARGGTVRTELSADAATLDVDLDRLHLVLREVMDNAFKFSRPGAEALVRAYVEGPPERLVVRVTNTGPTIPESVRAAIFLPYRQIESADTRRHGGLGLGLTVARGAAEGAGGSLTLEPGEPTTFRVELPRREDPVAREARELRLRALHTDAQALRAVKDFRAAYNRARELSGQLESSYIETVSAIARAVEARDAHTGTHIERVRDQCQRIGKRRGLSAATLRQLELGAVLHDVGKIGVSDFILQKPGPLDPDEWVIMREHPEIGSRILEGIGFLAEALEAVANHHERWDGTGYPRGLRGDAIPLFGRIVAVADAYDAMVSDRPYRAGLPVEVALAEIERCSGTQFDPEIVDLFLADPPANP